MRKPTNEPLNHRNEPLSLSTSGSEKKGLSLQQWLYPLTALVIIVAWLSLDYLTGAVYRAQIIPACLIITLLLLLRSADPSPPQG